MHTVRLLKPGLVDTQSRVACIWGANFLNKYPREVKQCRNNSTPRFGFYSGRKVTAGVEFLLHLGIKVVCSHIGITVGQIYLWYKSIELSGVIPVMNLAYSLSQLIKYPTMANQGFMVATSASS